MSLRMRQTNRGAVEYLYQIFFNKDRLYFWNFHY